MSKDIKELPLFSDPSEVSSSFQKRLEKLLKTVYSPTDTDLPKLPERHRLFAFRWATEYRTNSEWARIFHVSPTRIAEWKKDPRILQYYRLVRNEQNRMLLERMHILEMKAFQKLYELLDMKITSKNADVIRKTIMNILGVSTEGTLNLHVSTQSAAPTKDRVQQATKIDADVRTLREKLDELALLEDVVGIDKEVEGDAQDTTAGSEESTSDPTSD